jgi:hypothetical protein
LSAIWGVPLTLARALAPLAAVLLWHAAGLAVALDAAASCCLLGAAGLVLAHRCSGKDERDATSFSPRSNAEAPHFVDRSV